MAELMLVGVGRMGRPYAAAARRLGLRVRAVEAAARMAAVADQVDAVHPCHGDLDEHWVAATAQAARAGRPDGVVAFSEPQVMAAALLQDAEGLPGPSLHAAVLSRNKALQRGAFAPLGVGQPDHLVTDNLHAGTDWVRSRLPVVVKPLSASGSSGVELVTSVPDFSEVAARRARERLLVEAAVEGPEYSWEAIVVEGGVRAENVTAKETTGPPHFVEVCHRTGIELPPADRARVQDLAAGVLAGLRMRTGIVHLEFRLAAAGPVLMEVAVRTPGDFLMDLLSLTYGVDWFELVVRAAMSLPLPTPPSRPVRYAASHLPTAAPGVVTRVRGLDDVLAHPSVVHAALMVGEGDEVAPLRSSHQRVGHVVLAADSPEELEAALRDVRRALVVETRPGGVRSRTAA